MLEWRCGIYFYWFQKGKSIRDNALPHVNKEIVINVDIKEFFNSTSSSKVRQLAKNLDKIKLSDIAADLFTNICCYKGCLPTGSPTSPIISNLILKEFDFIILSYCNKNNIKYTRYADDLTFSSDSKSALSVINFTKKILKRFGYDLENRKTNIFRKGRRQLVTGIVVNSKANIARTKRRKLRAAIHRLRQGGKPVWEGKSLSIAELKGHLAFNYMINPTSAAPMIRRFNAIPKNTIKFGQLKYIQPDKKSRFSVFIDDKKKKEIDIISLWEEFPIPSVREEGKFDSWNRRDGTWKIFSAKSDPQKYLNPPYHEDPNYDRFPETIFDYDEPPYIGAKLDEYKEYLGYEISFEKGQVVGVFKIFNEDGSIRGRGQIHIKNEKILGIEKLITSIHLWDGE